MPRLPDSLFKSRTRHDQRKNTWSSVQLHRWRGGWWRVMELTWAHVNHANVWCVSWIGLIWLVEVGRATITVNIGYNWTSYFHYCKPLKPVTQVYVPCESDISCFALPLLSSPKRSCAKEKDKQHTCLVYQPIITGREGRGSTIQESHEAPQTVATISCPMEAATASNGTQ